MVDVQPRPALQTEGLQLPVISPPAHVFQGHLTDIVGFYLAPEYALRVGDGHGFQAAADYILSHPDLQVPASIESLRALIPGVFSPSMSSMLSSYFESLHPSVHTCDGFGGLKISTIFVNVLDELFSEAARLKRLALEGQKMTLSGEGQGRGGGAPTSFGTGASRGDEPNGGHRGSGGGKRGREGSPGGRGAGGNGRGGERGRGGGRGRGGRGPVLPHTPPNIFDQIPVTIINVGPCRTLPKPETSSSGLVKKTRRETCQSQAIQLADAIADTPFHLPPFVYTGAMDQPPPPNPEGTLYHATRLHKLDDFTSSGVDPVPYKRSNFFSPGPSFNLTDSVEQAISHVLHAGPTFRDAVTHVLSNPIVVLAFRVNWHIIVEGERTGFVGMGEPGGKLGEEDSEWIAENEAANGKTFLHNIEYEWIIGPFLTPLVREHRYRIAECWTQSGITPVHVAAVSASAFSILNKSLVAIFLQRSQEHNQN